MKTLFDYQKEIVQKANKSNALFMKMGTGKTITSLKIAEKWQCEKLLVVCLKSKIQDWIDEIEEETYFCKGEYMVINFESVWRSTKAIDFCNSKTMIIVDESHKIKNPKSKVSQYMRYLGNMTKYKLVLTGTPQNEEYYDYWMQMGFIDSPLYKIPLKDFENYYVNYNMEIDIIKSLCIKMNRPYSIYNGEIKDLTNFKNKENGIAIVNYASGATGINDLCISNIGIFFSPPDGDYILFSQAKSRLDRIGQTKQPIFYFLQCQKTIEVPIYDAFKNGDNFTNELYLNWLEKEK